MKGLVFSAVAAGLLALSARAETIRETREIQGWQVHIHPDLLAGPAEATTAALGILESQLAGIAEILPRAAVVKLREVPLFFSPPYPDTRPTAAYHPNIDWLRKNGRDPAMARAVEFTNAAIFAREANRMPNFVLHELAHAWHDRVLPMGYANPELRAAFKRAAASGTYERVERWHGDGRPNTFEKAYAMNNPMEYFAETTEAFFGTNDFFPFTHAELKRHDPAMFDLLVKLWGIPVREVGEVVSPPPPEWNVPDFYTQAIDAGGFPIVASEKVSPFALREAAWLVGQMLANRPDVRQAMVAGGSRMCILAHNEFTTDLPEFAKLEAPPRFKELGLTGRQYWDARARGTGGSRTDPYCSCGEENLLGGEGDPYFEECILIHEFAHAIHWRGLMAVDGAFDERLRAAYRSAIAAGLWRGAYAGTNHAEYFAEGVQSWFDDNRENDREHNHVDTRAELREYDPGLAAILEEVFGDTRLRYSKPNRRLYGHLDGYDPAKVPAFRWPERLDKARARIFAKPIVLP